MRNLKVKTGNAKLGSVQKFKLSALTCLAFAFLSSCGEASHFSPKDSEIATDALTEAENPDGRSYTAFSPLDQVQKLKDSVSVAQESKEFASNIESASLQTKADELTVILKWKDLSKPLEFVGKLMNQAGTLQAQLKDKTQQRPDLEIVGTCATTDCQVFDAYLQDRSQRRAGIIIRHEERTMKLVGPASQKENLKLLPVEKQKAIGEAEKGFRVSVHSTEIYPGRSYYEIKNDSSSISGELLSTDDGTVPTHSDGKFASLGKLDLVGNNQGNSPEGGELQFKVSNELTKSAVKGEKESKKQINYYLVMEKQTSNQLKSIISKPLGFDSVKDETGNKLVKQILDDENNENIQRYIAAHMTRLTDPKRGQTGGVNQMSQLLACHEGDRENCKRDKSGNEKTETVKKMVSILRENKMPAAWTMIASIESNFEPKVYNRSSGAYGYWQFIYRTAAAFQLIQNGKDYRGDLHASTKAAVNYFKLLLQYWKGDVKMAVISYNMGQGAVQKACIKGASDKSNCDIIKNKRESLDDVSELYDINQKDFWRLYRLHAFGAVSRNGKEGENYTLKFISGNVISAHPQKYGYANKPVDLN